jgi:RNA polymerase sigma factor (sigma-70 family)
MGRPSDEELVAAVEKVAKRLARLYRFSYHEVEDLVQECYVEAIKALDKYDASRPLVNFLAIHLRNRLHNFKRNKHERITAPCESCPLGAWVKKSDSCKIYEIKEDCKLYAKWININAAKKNLSQPVNMGDSDPTLGEGFDQAQFNDIYNKLRRELSEFGQMVMFKIMNGDRVKPTEMVKFKEEVDAIIGTR